MKKKLLIFSCLVEKPLIEETKKKLPPKTKRQEERADRLRQKKQNKKQKKEKKISNQVRSERRARKKKRNIRRNKKRIRINQLNTQAKKLKRIEKREREQSKGIYGNVRKVTYLSDRKSNYYEYISSKKWFSRRKQYFKKYKQQCISCFSTKNIHLHHITYNSLKNEEDKDLAPLCKICHAEFHKDYKHNDKIGFIEFVKRKRSELLK